ncbi:MAG: hypothetical protein ABSF23_08445 [Terracidiphilus sp.]|jgi:hypothetical protein
MNAMTQQQKPPFELNGWQHVAVFLCACLLVVSRRPDAVFHAQFCCEDGHVWFADAYNLGWWNALFRAQDGYFQTVPRLAAALALLVPLALAPLVTNLLHILVQAAPVSVLLGSRSSAWGSLRFRALMAAVYIALPNNAEMTFGITWAQWQLVLCTILLVVASAPRGWPGRTFDCIFFLLSGLSGPFCILVLPIAAFLAWKRREWWRWVQCAVLAVCALTQLYSLLILDPKGRANFPIGIDAAIFTRMLAGNVFAGAVLGRVRLAVLPGTGAFVFLLCVAVVGTAIVVACFLKARLEMKLFLVFTCLIFAASLLHPSAYPPPGSTMWQLMVKAVAIRYWFFPSLAFAWTLLWCVRSGTVILKSAASVLVCLMAFGMLMNWRIPAFQDFHFAQYARAFEAAPPGTVMVIPEYWEGWNIRLVKHASR